jgi:hypothetical protein
MFGFQHIAHRKQFWRCIVLTWPAAAAAAPQVCAYHEWNLDGLVEMCWEYLDLVSVTILSITM